ncbi:hypothetical protein E2562_018736, partial [Oryza meyeriana var. granulata]
RRSISHPNHRHLLPWYHLHNAIAGSSNYKSFTNITGEDRPLIDPSFPFLPKCDDLELVDNYNGILLSHCWRQRRFDYLVVNPVTKHWVVLPDSGWSDKRPTARLVFDPAVSSSHLHVEGNT